MLPKLETPTYELTLPSTGKKIKYRPYLVKEEKILQVALESKKSDEILNAVKELIRNCTFNSVDPDKLEMVDIEYLFIKLRAKASGEQVELELKCSNKECGKYVNYILDLDEVEPTYPDENISDKIMLNDTIGVVMKRPTIGMYEIDETDDPLTYIDKLIVSVFDSDKVYPFAESTKKEREEFIDSLSDKNLQKIKQFLDSGPYIEHLIEFKCPHCGTTTKITLKGLDDFFM